MSDPTDRDLNAQVGALLRDLATAYESQPAAFGYKRASTAILMLDRPVRALLDARGKLEKISGIGPKSERVILEVLRTGESPTVEQAVHASENAAAVMEERALRSNYMSRARVLSILREPIPDAVALDDYRGDFQVHSEWSDGRQTLDQLADAAIDRGYEHSAVTDHSHGLRIAGGMSAEDVARQHAAIDRLNDRQAGRFRLIKGIEANIRADGSLDTTADDLEHVELVLAAPHAKLRSADDQTERLLAAVRTPRVHILAHPRGRHYGDRAGVHADWPRVFDVAKSSNVAIEIDGDPWRQDLDFHLARRALESGCLIALDSDAHAPHELANVEFAVAHARLAGIPPERVINCWPLNRLLSWLSDR